MISSNNMLLSNAIIAALENNNVLDLTLFTLYNVANNTTAISLDSGYGLTIKGFLDGSPNMTVNIESLDHENNSLYSNLYDYFIAHNQKVLQNINNMAGPASLPLDYKNVSKLSNAFVVACANNNVLDLTDFTIYNVAHNAAALLLFRGDGLTIKCFLDVFPNMIVNIESLDHENNSLYSNLYDHFIAHNQKVIQNISSSWAPMLLLAFRYDPDTSLLDLTEDVVKNEVCSKIIDVCLRYPPKHPRILEGYKSERAGLKYVSDTQIREMLKLPEEYTIGEAVDNDGCFFDSFAQLLNTYNNTEEYTEKSLRLACCEYVSKNPEAAISLINADKISNISLANYDEEMSKTREEIEFPQSGRIDVEGIMLCRQLDLDKFYVYQIVKDLYGTEFYSLCEVTQEKVINIDFPDLDLNKPTLIVENLHFVPILPYNKINNENNSLSACNRDKNEGIPKDVCRM